MSLRTTSGSLISGSLLFLDECSDGLLCSSVSEIRLHRTYILFLFIYFFKGALQLDSETIGEFWKDGKVMGMENNSLERWG